MQPTFAAVQNKAISIDVLADVRAGAVLLGRDRGRKRRNAPPGLGRRLCVLKKYRRSATENARELQRKALDVREKSPWRKNNGKQWKSNAKNNGNSRQCRHG